MTCGNDYTYGQVSIGNWYSVELDDYILEPATCITLPLPTIQYPELLLQTDEHGTLSCAERALLNGQSLNINSQMAIRSGGNGSSVAKFSAKADAGGGGYFSWLNEVYLD